ncbi:hypothetical protein BKA69DRAFT_1127026 [Paraphysoderma sedebokerense]|nr:hypothetical protein BKA69DRAFT_1129244 [Paraphysoderma sedebokerense]KAI9138907.1 hypothetical protein BKA69DRAFT_1127026 [Paraphysoderma sedebokerense]
MQYGLAIFLFVCFSLQLVQGQSACPKIKIRKEIRSLSNDEVKDLIDAIKKMKDEGVYDKFTQKHFDGLKYHGTMWFYPFHRAMVNEFEEEMLKRSKGIVKGLPYWDEGRDFNAPFDSKIFTPAYFGDVVYGQKHCLKAPFEGWTHNGKCVEREVQTPNILSASSSETWLVPSHSLASGLSTFSSFETFSRLTEGIPHGPTHVWIGGNMLDVTVSPADPMFWIHHNYVDFIWATWQRSRNGQYFYSYSNDELTPDDVLSPSALVPLYKNGTYRYTLADVQNYRTRLCYDFDVSPSSSTPTNTTKTNTTSTAKASPTSVPISPTPTPSPGPGNTTIIRLHKRQAANAPKALPLIKTLTDDQIKKFWPRLKIEDYRKAEELFNKVTSDINEQVAKNGKSLNDYPTLSTLWAQGSVPQDDGKNLASSGHKITVPASAFLATVAAVLFL